MSVAIAHRHVTTLSALRERYADDTKVGGPGATPFLVRALERIGWRSIPDAPIAVLADELRMMIDDCVRGHRDLYRLSVGIAGVFRDFGPDLDGGLPPAEAYLPAAEELLRLYVQREAIGSADSPPM